MRFSDLRELLRRSGSSRQYFFSLPVECQIALRPYFSLIHTAADLHRYAALTDVALRQDRRGGWRR